MPQETINVPLALSFDQRSVKGYDEAITNANDQRRDNLLYEITRGVNGAEPTATLTSIPGVTKHAGTFGSATQTQYLVMSNPAATWTNYQPWVAVKDSTNINVVTSDTAITVLSDTNYVPRFWENTRLSGADYCVLQLQKTDDPAASTNSQKVYISSTVGTWNQVTGTSSIFTTFAHRGKMEFLDGYGLIASGKRIYNSAANDLQNWNAGGDYITITNTDDELQGLARLKRKVLAFGRRSVEEFEIPSPGNATGSILNRVANSVNEIGLGDVGGPGSISGRTHYYCRINDLLFYIGRFGSVSGDQSLIVYDGNRHNKLSREYEDKILSSATIYSVNRISIHGKVAVAMQMTAPGTNPQVAFCYFPDLNDFLFLRRSVWSVVNNGFHYAGIADPQRLYTFANSNKWIDDTTTYTVTCQFKVPNLDADYKDMSRFGLIGDTTSLTANVQVQFSKDDGRNWSTARNIDMSKMHKFIQKCPMARELMVRVAYAGDQEIRLRRAYMDMRK